jgi:hypothetical protein
MVLIDETAHFEHEQIIRCNIKPESVEKSANGKNRQFQKKSKGYTLRPPFSKNTIFF